MELFVFCFSLFMAFIFSSASFGKTKTENLTNIMLAMRWWFILTIVFGILWLLDKHNVINYFLT